MIKTQLDGAKGIWLDEQPGVLWAYRTTACMPTGEIPFRLMFGSEAVILDEIGLTSYRVFHPDEQRNDEEMRLQLDLLNEVKETAEQRIV